MQQYCPFWYFLPDLYAHDIDHQKALTVGRRLTTAEWIRYIFFIPKFIFFLLMIRNVRVAEQLALPTSDHRVVGSNPTGCEILPVPKRRFIAQSLSRSPFHRLEMTEILLKGRKTLTHPSIFWWSLMCKMGSVRRRFKHTISCEGRHVFH